jgi:hypothetical protein
MVTIPGGPPGAVGNRPPQRSPGAGMSTLAIVAIVMVGGCVVALPVLIALLLPAVQAAREAARRAQCTNNVKQTALAFQTHADIFKQFPAAFGTEANGESPRSWRIDLLPYMESRAVYDQYRKDEAWNGPMNSQLAAQMPLGYRCISDGTSPPTNTDYAVIYGNGAMFDANQPCPLMAVRDGLSLTLMVVEASGANIHWMEPRDLEFAKMQCVINGPGGNEISSHHPGSAVVGFGDASARALSTSIAPQVLRALITRDGGEALGDVY